MNTLHVSPFGTDKTPMMAHASSQGEEIMKLFCKLNEQGTTIVQVTHSEKTRLTASASCNCAMAGSSKRNNDSKKIKNGELIWN